MKILMIGPANLGPYHFARFRAIIKWCPQFTYLRVITKEHYRPWSSDLEKAPCQIDDYQNDQSISNVLKEQHTDVLVTVGYNNWTIIRSGLWAKRNKVPVVLVSDSTIDDNHRTWWKEFIKKLIVRGLFDAAFVGGSKSGAYAKMLGIPKESISYGVNVVDNNHFEKSNENIQLRISFPAKYFLTVTRLSEEKNLGSLLKAYRIFRESGGTWGLVLVGTGPQEQELKRSVTRDVQGDIYWYGWARYEELPSIYRRAACFILPSISEPWGLVVNEAMAAGLPVLVSRKCGCVPELCQDGINGYSFDPYDIEELSELLMAMSSKENRRRSMGEASRRIISDYTTERWSETLFGMCHSLLAEKQ